MAKCKDCNFYGVCILDRRSADADAAGCKIFEVGERDFVEVVRCKDCKYKRHNKKYDVILCDHDIGVRGLLRPDDFCSYGERKDNA